MCTSCASKPARSNTAAVSTWLLTPCSRRIATAGRAPRAMYGRGDVLLGIEASARPRARDRPPQSAPRTPRRRTADHRAGGACAMRSPTRRACRSAQASSNCDRADLASARAARSPARRGTARHRPSPCRAEHVDERRGSSPAQHLHAPRPAPRRTAARARAPRAAGSAMSRPQWPANAISTSVTNRPPSERSW